MRDNLTVYLNKKKDTNLYIVGYFFINYIYIVNVISNVFYNKHILYSSNTAKQK